MDTTIYRDITAVFRFEIEPVRKKNRETDIPVCLFVSPLSLDLSSYSDFL